jgi:hypothetical protein
MITRFKFQSIGASLIAGTVASVLAACASTSVRPTDAVGAPAPLTQLRSDPPLRDRALVATQAADTSLGVADQPRAASRHEAYRVHTADQRVESVRTQAENRLAEEQPPRLRTESKKARLDAGARQLDLAQNQAVLSELEGAGQTLAAITARGDAASNWGDQQAPDARREAECAELAASISRQETAPQRPADDLLQASVSGIGLVVTLAGFAIFR